MFDKKDRVSDINRFVQKFSKAKRINLPDTLKVADVNIHTGMCKLFNSLFYTYTKY